MSILLCRLKIEGPEIRSEVPVEVAFRLALRHSKRTVSSVLSQGSLEKKGDVLEGGTSDAGV